MNVSNAVLPGDCLRRTYEFMPVEHLYRTEFYIWGEAMERWKKEGLPEDWEPRNLFNFDPPSIISTGVDLGWCEPPFLPLFEEKVIEDNGDTEIIQDAAGRHLRVFKGRRHGFMPEYVNHPVSNMADWESVAPRLDASNEIRWLGTQERAIGKRAEADGIGGILNQPLIGGYMYLRALAGPEDLLYMFYDQPEVIHAAMRAWLELCDEALRRVQSVVEIDEMFLAEDICYNHGLLISPDTMREFLLPYYQELISKARSRQNRGVYLHIDTDGDARPAIPIYSQLGLTKMSPFEVASGCDVVEIGKQYPDLVMAGGIDKRILAAGKDAIEAHLQHILPFMRDRGGYYPTCDHGVPVDVSFENYIYYRKRVCELDHS